jgi:ketosteroid isomerase-like protein
MTSSPLQVIERLAQASSDHDLDGIVGCFAPDYVNETPAHPSRGFQGHEQVRRNWAQILGGVPDLQARLLAVAVDADTVWSEWLMTGTRRDGAQHEMRGVNIFQVTDGLIQAARFYLEPVEHHSGSVDAAVRRTIAPAHDSGSST